LGNIVILTKIFKNTRLKVADSADNTIKTHFKINRQHHQYNDSGVFRLKCLICDQIYIGQTGRDFTTRYKENIRDIDIIKKNHGTPSTYLIITMSMAQ
jgi:hypothetical protein